LLVKLATTSDYVGIDERSDGLRQFIALRAFLHVENLGDAKPILLIDEESSSRASPGATPAAFSDLARGVLRSGDAGQVAVT
jgi:hypothetical protein